MYITARVGGLLSSTIHLLTFKSEYFVIKQRLALAKLLASPDITVYVVCYTHNEDRNANYVVSGRVS